MKTINIPDLTNKDIQRFWDKVNRRGDSDCWEWIAYDNRKGYGIMNIKGNNYLAHRLSWKIHYGNIAKNLCVLHTCDNPKCVNPTHLWLGTVRENTIDAKQKGRLCTYPQQGEYNNNSKLTWDNVRQVRQLYKTGKYTLKELGEKFGVCFGQISNILLNKTWIEKRGSNKYGNMDFSR